MIEPKSSGMTMKQLKAYKKSSRGKKKSYRQGRIDGLSKRPDYKKFKRQQ